MAGRRSAASLSIVAGAIDGRPKAPSELTKSQAQIWDRVVANEAADTFKTAALQNLLRDYCRHTDTADRLTRDIDKTEEAWLLDEEGLRRFDKMLAMRDRETKASADRATKLRLTNQSRYTPQAAGTAAKKASTELKPWQMTG